MKKLFVFFIGLFLVGGVIAQTNEPSKKTTRGEYSSEPDIIIGTVTDQVYSGKPYAPDPVIRYGSITLQKNKDYTISYSNNVNVGVAVVNIVGKGNYTGNTELKFNITPKSINQLNFSPVNEQVFRNAEIKPDVLIKDGPKALVKGTDYTIVYKNNLNVGTATITVTGKGNYKDTKVINFRIAAKSMSNASNRGSK